MTIINIMISKIKTAIRTKELYIYIIGMPLIFMIIYGSFASAAFSEVKPIKIGFLNEDLGVSYTLGDENFNVSFGNDFYRYIKSLTYEDTDVNVFNILNISSAEEAELKATKLEVGGVVHIESNFSILLLNACRSLTYYSLIGQITDRLNRAFAEGNTTLANKYLMAMIDISQFANISYEVHVTIIGDPTYSDSMKVYEYMWKYLINYLFMKANEFTQEYADYLVEEYEIELDTESVNTSMISQRFNIEFRRIGGKEGLRESFMQMYYSILVPGQIIQSIMMAATSIVYLVGYEISRGLIERLKLTRLRASEYIIGTLLSWSVVALFQATILLAIAYGLGYLTTIGSIVELTMSIAILAIAGILTAAFSLIVISFLKENIAGTITLMFTLVISMFIAGYFPVPNPVLGNFLGRSFTLFDLVPWRSAIVALRKSLILVHIYEPMDVIPDLLLLVFWTIIYTVIAFVVFSRMRLKKRE